MRILVLFIVFLPKGILGSVLDLGRSRGLAPPPRVGAPAA